MFRGGYFGRPWPHLLAGASEQIAIRLSYENSAETLGKGQGKAYAQYLYPAIGPSQLNSLLKRPLPSECLPCFSVLLAARLTWCNFIQIHHIPHLSQAVSLFVHFCIPL